MANHPNRSKSRPVVQATVQAEILGVADSAEAALEVLNKWAHAARGVAAAWAENMAEGAHATSVGERTRGGGSALSDLEIR